MNEFHQAARAGQWEYNFVEGKVFITGTAEHDVQIALDAEEAIALLEFLWQHKVELSQLMHATDSNKGNEEPHGS